MSDHKPASDQATTPGDTNKVRQGVEWMSQWLQHDSQANAPDSTEQAELQIREQTESTEVSPEEDEVTTGEQLVQSPETTPTKDEAKPPVEKTEPKQSIKQQIEAGLIAFPLLFGAASSAAATQEMAQTQPYEQHATILEVRAAPRERHATPTENMPSVVDPEIEVLADAHDLERQRRIEEDAAGRLLKEPTISAAPPPPDADPV
ncbi:MAG: hypothetical protein WCK70_17290 [Chloroflexales bacterium]